MLIAVRIAGYDLDEMCDLKTLKQWTRSGRVKPTDLVKVDGEWIEARHASVLKGIFAASTWDAAEDVIWTSKAKHPSGKKTIQSGVEASFQDSETLENQEFSKIKKLRLDPSAIRPLDPFENTKTNRSNVTNVTTDSPTEQFSLSMPPEDDFQNTIRTSESKLSFADEVALEYQRSKPNSSSQEGHSSLAASSSSVEIDFAERGQLWNPSVDIKDQLGLLVDEVPRKSHFSWIRLMLLVLPGAFILFLVRAFVISEATTVFPEATGPSVQQTTDTRSPNQNAPIPTKSQSDTLFTLESNLKGMLRNNAQQVTPEQSLSDALRVDLEYVGLEIRRIDAKVLKWKGRMLDKPRAATIDIVLTSQGEMENELILATLVIAKYSVRYYLEMPEFTVSIRDGDLLLSKTIQTEDAQFLYLQPGSLKKFIEILSK